MSDPHLDNPTPIPIWLDCDTGHDDAYAILLALQSPRSHLLGISTVHGNAPLHHTHSNTRAILQALGRNRSDVKVVKGASKPLEREPAFASAIHGESGLDGVTLLPKIEDGQYAVGGELEYVAQTILAQPPGTVWLVATGPLTNIALLLRQTPALVSHLKGMSIMGGAIGGGYTDAPLGTVEGTGERFGNWTPYAEFNIYSDPEAAAEVLEHKELAAKTTLVPLDLTHQVRGHGEVQRLLFGKARQEENGELSFVRRLMQQVLMFFSGTYRTQFGIMDGPPLHDPVAVYAVLFPDEFEDRRGERWQVKVVQKGKRFKIDDDPFNRLGQTNVRPAEAVGVRIPRGLNLGRFWDAIDQALSRAERNGTI